MKLIVKILLSVLIVLVLGVVGLLSYVKFALPKVADAPDIQIEITPERLERGEYLSNYVSGCIECHSQRDWHTFSGPVIPGTEGAGGMAFTPEMGMPGVLYPPNITPDKETGIGLWSDQEIGSAIRVGLGRHAGRRIAVMPWQGYTKMTSDDVTAIVSYLRSIDPIEHQVPDEVAPGQKARSPFVYFGVYRSR